RHSPTLPTGKSLLDLRKRLVNVDITDDDQVRGIRDVVLRNKRAQVVSRQRADRFLIRHDKAVRMISEDCLLKTFVNEETRVGTSGANLLDRVFLGQLHLGVRERWMLSNVAHQVEE